MRHWKGLVLGLALALLAAAPLLAQDESAEKPAKAEKAAKEPKAEKSALRGEYAIMASECQLTDAQKAQLEMAVKPQSDALAAWEEANMASVCQMTDAQKAALEAAVKAKSDALAAWEEANRAKIVDLEKQQADAKEKGDKVALKRIGEEVKALWEQFFALRADHSAKIVAILTPEQRQVWEEFKLYFGLMRHYAKAELDEGQQAKVRALANEAARKMLAVTGAGKEAEDAKNKIEQELKASVENDVLTAEQKGKVNAPKVPKEEAPKTGAEGAKEGPAGM